MGRKAGCFIACLWMVLSGMDYLFGWAFSRGSFYKQQWVNSFRNESFDLVILGSSRSLTTIDIEELSHVSGPRTINLSLDGSSPVDQVCLLKLFLENGNTFDRILIQVDHWLSDSDGPSADTLRYFHPFRRRKSLQAVLDRPCRESGWMQRCVQSLLMIGYAR